MRLFFIIVSFVLLQGTLKAQTYIRPLQKIDLSLFKSFDTLTFDCEKVFNALKSRPENAEVKLYLNAYGVFDLSLSPSNLLLYNKHPETDYHHWKGIVKGSDKIVRINSYENALSGYIEMQNSRFLFFETVEFNNRYLLLIYYNNDFDTHAAGLRCGNSEIAHADPIKTSPLKRGDTTYTQFSCAIIKVGVVCSYRLYKKNKYDSIATFNEVKDVFNMSDGVYAKYIGVRLKIAFQAVSLDSNAVMNTQPSTDVRLPDFDNKKQKFKRDMKVDIYHLFTEYFNPTDNASGRGYLAKACDQYNSSISMDYSTIMVRALILAHELGHNLSAEHTDASNCNNTATASIMCPTTIGSSLIFNSTESSRMKGFINNKLLMKTSCMNYPVLKRTNDYFIDLYNNDSVKLNFEKMGDYYLDGWYKNEEMYQKAESGKDLWVKQHGFYRLLLRLDTISNLKCKQEIEYFAPSKDFTVTTSNEYGYGSLKAAILNSNYFKGRDTIRFRLKDTITVFNITTPLPPLTDHCLIDGTTQTGYRPPDASGYYRPGVVLNNSDLTGAAYPSAFLLGYGNYEIRGLEFRNFNLGITNSELVKLSNKYFELMPAVFNTSSHTIIKACQFRNNQSGVYVYFGDTIRNNDKFTVGTGALKDANFFKSPTGDGIYLNRIDSAFITGNYFGTEPGSDSMGSINQGIYMSTVYNAYVKNNSFSNSRMYAYNTSGAVYGNVFGYDPFLERRTGTLYSAIVLTGYNANGNSMLIGGTAPGQGNSIYNQKRYKNYGGAPVMIFDVKNVKVIGNRIEQSDSGAILLQSTSSATAYIPFKNIRIDSVIHNCVSGNQKIYGRVKPQYANDSFDLHFYSAPPGVKKNKEPMHDYLGTMKLMTTDTLEKTFVFSCTGRFVNEGVCFTATSGTLQLTGNQSEVVYPSGNNAVTFVKVNDTCLCPRKILNLQMQTGFNNYEVNNVPVTELKLNTPGYYNISASNQGCKYRTTMEFTRYPDYLSNVNIDGVDKYKALQNYDFTISNISRPWGWSNYVWKGNNYSLLFGTKTLARSYFLNDSALLEYHITDINKCTYSIVKKLKNEKPSTDIETIEAGTDLLLYPNPTTAGIMQITGLYPGIVQLYNSEGKLINQWDNTREMLEISVDNLATGIYFIKTDKQGVLRFAKQ